MSHITNEQLRNWNKPAWKPNRTTEQYDPAMPGNTSGGMHVRNANNRPHAYIISRLTHLLSAINDTNILHDVVAELSVERAQTARLRDTPAA